MKRIIPILIMFMTPMLLLSCSNMRHNVGLRGIIVDDEHMILDGDTFSICERINDSLLIVSEEVYVDEVPDYLIKKEANGFYYLQTEANGISSVEGTDDFVAFTNRDVYDIKRKKVLFRTECDILEGFSFMGASDDKYLFCNIDSLCFSDGKYLGLQPDVYCSAADDKNLVRLTLGAQHMDVSPQELYQCIGKDFPKDSTVQHFKKDYFIKPRTEYEHGRAGYDLDIEMPLGKNVADIAIRQWMLEQIRNEVFSLLELNPEEIPVPKCGDMGEMTQWFDRIGLIWEKLLRNDYQEGDTLYANISSHIVIRKIADNTEYTTYYFSSLPYTGGMHELPRSYYATYDKQRQVFLTASKSIRKETRTKFAMAALQNLRKSYDERNEQKSSWKDFTNAIFSFNCPFEENDAVNKIMELVYSDMYCCDKAAEWYGKNTPYNISDFPLPHFAILPEGAVLTYHPYQIDCFASGEYHAVIPLKDITQYLQYEYKQDTSPLRLHRFIKNEGTMKNGK